MCGCGCAALHPPPLLLLANHHATLLYLGHSNVLLLSPLADALCCNLRKIGWEEEKSEESGRREGVVTEARSFLLSKNLTSSFVITVSVFASLPLFLPPLSPSVFSSLCAVKGLHVLQLPQEPHLPNQPLCVPRFYA